MSPWAHDAYAALYRRHEISCTRFTAETNELHSLPSWSRTEGDWGDSGVQLKWMLIGIILKIFVCTLCMCVYVFICVFLYVYACIHFCVVCIVCSYVHQTWKSVSLGFFCYLGSSTRQTALPLFIYRVYKMPFKLSLCLPVELAKWFSFWTLLGLVSNACEWPAGAGVEQQAQIVVSRFSWAA